MLRDTTLPSQPFRSTGRDETGASLPPLLIVLVTALEFHTPDTLRKMRRDYCSVVEFIGRCCTFIYFLLGLAFTPVMRGRDGLMSSMSDDVQGRWRIFAGAKSALLTYVPVKAM